MRSPLADGSLIVLRSCSGILRRPHMPFIFVVVFLLLVSFAYFSTVTVLFNGRIENPRISDVSRVVDPPGIVDLDNDELRLSPILRAAAMEDRTVILTTLNAAWASAGSIVDLFIESFQIGIGTRQLLGHLVIIAFDREAYLRCMAMHPHCFSLITTGIDFSDEESFMSDGYLKMMWRRIDFLRMVLEMGYNFVFTDADVMWFRNPFPQFFPDEDFQIACDKFLGNPLDRNNRANGGLNFVKSNNRTIEFYKFWYSSRETFAGFHDQDVLNIIKFDPFVDKLGLKIRFLSTAYFGGICESSRNFNVVCSMHANCCVGLSSKISDLKLMLQDWRRYMASPLSTLKNSSLPLWSVPQSCSPPPVHQQIL